MSFPASPRSLLVWHAHGSWMESFVAGQHRYVIPVNPAKDADGRGLMGRNWPRAQEVSVDQLRDEDIDLAILQRPEEFDLADRWLGRRPGVDVPAVYVEHNTPRPYAVDTVHPLAGRRGITLIHVTDFNRLMWDNGLAPTRVITHGIADPGPLYTGDIAAAATMINEPLRRWRTVGADLVVPAEAGVVSSDVRTLAHALEGFVTDLASATVAGKSARDFAMAHFALDRFLAQWDGLIDECCG
jgi:hypothetical protein